MMTKSFYLFLFIVFNTIVSAQTIAITIDDVPNVNLYKKDGYNLRLLTQLDSLNIPSAIFINEKLIFGDDDSLKNKYSLEKWIENPYVTPANHSFSHYRYSAAGFEKFSNDIIKGSRVSKKLSGKHNKEYKYFRFPYNDGGADSLQHIKMRKFLESENYILTPFTVESSDWMFNWLYEYYIDINKPEKAAEIGKAYVNKTMEYFKFFDKLAAEKYGKKINHIYLCHDNSINADYLTLLIEKLKLKGYKFDTLQNVMKDKIYSQEDSYYKKWGISWLYRWMDSNKERVKFMKTEPDMKKYIDEFNKLSKVKNKY